MKKTISLGCIASVAVLVLMGSGLPPALGQAGPSKQTATQVAEGILPEYLKIQMALAADTLDGVQAASFSIAKQAGKDAGVRKSAEKLAKAKSLKEARDTFKDLSKAMISQVKQSKPAGTQIVYCPMAGARWIQAEGEIQNPYFGKEMLSCGEKQT